MIPREREEREQAALHARLTALLPRVSMPRFRYPVEWRVELGLPCRVSLRIEVEDRDTGAARPLAQTRIVPSALFAEDDRSLARWLLRMVVDFAVHEVAECFLLDGVRAFDPHYERVRP